MRAFNDSMKSAEKRGKKGRRDDGFRSDGLAARVFVARVVFARRIRGYDSLRSDTREAMAAKF